MRLIEIMNKHNKRLMFSLIPNPDEPIYCNGVWDKSDPIFNDSFKQIKTELQEELKTKSNGK